MKQPSSQAFTVALQSFNSEGKMVIFTPDTIVPDIFLQELGEHATAIWT